MKAQRGADLAGASRPYHGRVRRPSESSSTSTSDACTPSWKSLRSWPPTGRSGNHQSDVPTGLLVGSVLSYIGESATVEIGGAAGQHLIEAVLQVARL
jgi:hypothetical protein